MRADIVFGLENSDEGKGKVTNELIKSGSYTHCLRYAGGANAGHTIYLNGEKVVTHSVPSGALHKVRSIIGPGCVLNERMFFEELATLEKSVPGISKFVKIANGVHITTESHLLEEHGESKIGTTKKGIGPTYRDKYARTGIRAESIPSLKEFLINIYEELHLNENIEVLCEGAQALGLDIDFGDYPYVTSSHCGVGGVLNNGIPHTAIRNVFGVCKCYDTYVGAKLFEDYKDPALGRIGDVGQEYGATTGRRRQVNYLNLDTLRKHVAIAAPNRIYFNKLDVLETVDVWKVIENQTILDLKNKVTFMEHIKNFFLEVEVVFSGSPYEI